MNRHPTAYELGQAVLDWWKEAQYLTTGPRGEMNVFDSEPDFVTLANKAASIGSAPLEGTDQTVARGIELLALCQELQSAKDGIDRPAPGTVDKTKTLDQFARDIGTATAFHSALLRLLPMTAQLADLGRKLEARGEITVTYGEDYAQAALRHFQDEEQRIEAKEETQE
jgi:hypothetical protein